LFDISYAVGNLNKGQRKKAACLRRITALNARVIEQAYYMHERRGL